MEIKHDRSIIAACHPNAERLIQRGYAQECLSAIRLRYHIGSKHPVSPIQRNDEMYMVMESIAQRILCYQYNNVHKVSYDCRDWGLHFWCNHFGTEYPEKSLVGQRDFSYIILTFNNLHSVEERENTLQIVLEVLAQFEGNPNIYVSVQYGVLYDDAKINKDAAFAADRLVGKKCKYHNMIGRIVKVEDSDRDSSYYFMKSRARTRGYALKPADVLLLAWDMEE